jgi:hypothetical protein
VGGEDIFIGGPPPSPWLLRSECECGRRIFIDWSVVFDQGFDIVGPDQLTPARVTPVSNPCDHGEEFGTALEA